MYWSYTACGVLPPSEVLPFLGHAKLEISGCLEGLLSLHEGMYFLMQLMGILALQNTLLHEETPPAGIVDVDYRVPIFQ